MTANQKKKLKRLLERKKPTEVHHGDCVGADKEFHDISYGLKIPIVIHPPSKNGKRAFCTDAECVHETKPFIDRNHDIVDACVVLFATPNSETEVLRSGTWATVRYAKKMRKRVIIIYPNGTKEVN